MSAKKHWKINIDYECSLLLTTIWVEMVSEGALLFEVYKTTILKPWKNKKGQKLPPLML